MKGGCMVNEWWMNGAIIKNEGVEINEKVGMDGKV